MQKEIVQFAVVSQDGQLQRTGRSSILQPEIKFKTGTTQWYEDKLKKDGKTR